MYSLNVPVPAPVAALAGELARDLPGAHARARGEHTLSVKRLGNGDHTAYSRLEAHAREELSDQPAFEGRVTGVEYFADAVTGTSPVVYLAVESPELVALHRRLAEAFEPVAGIEGESYVPHVTIARGGAIDAARQLADRDVDPITWTVSELVFWDATRNQPVSSVSLPA